MRNRQTRSLGGACVGTCGGTTALAPPRCDRAQVHTLRNCCSHGMNNREQRRQPKPVAGPPSATSYRSRYRCDPKAGAGDKTLRDLCDPKHSQHSNCQLPSPDISPQDRLLKSHPSKPRRCDPTIQTMHPCRPQRAKQPQSLGRGDGRPGRQNPPLRKDAHP